MKKDIHPEYVETEVTCTCGNTFTTRSTATSGSIHADVCSNCHPFYTGKQKILDTGGRVARFEARYAKKADKKEPTRPSRSVPAPTRPRAAWAGARRFVARRRSAPQRGATDVRGRRQACSPSTPSSSGSSADPRRTPTRGWPSGSTSGTPS